MKLTLLVTAAAMLATAAANGQYVQRAAPMVDPYVRSNNFSGVILVSRTGKVLMRRSYGLANVEHNVPVSDHTRFYIGSVSKMFTAAAILQLRDAGKIGLDDVLGRYVPDFPRAETITIRQLLTHRSGLAQDTVQPDYFEKATRPYTLEQAVDAIKKIPPIPDPGRRTYSNSNYVLLALVVERASGESFADYLHHHLFAPSQMTHTGLHQSWTQLVPNRAQGYSPVGAHDLANARPYDYSIGTGAGSVCSTADDLRHWFEALRSGGVLGKGSVDELFGLSGGNPYVGSQFAVANRSASELTGWDGVGFASALEYSARDDILVIVLSNRNVPNVASDLAHELTKLAYGQQASALHLDNAPITPDEVRHLTGRYKLGNDFYVPGTTLDFVPCGEGICERQRDGVLVGLLREENGAYIHRSSWGRIRFHFDQEGNATGLRFFDQFEAVRTSD